MALGQLGQQVIVHDPMADPGEAEHEYGMSLTAWNDLPQAEGLVMAVAHNEFKQRPLSDFLSKVKPGGVFVDVKCQMDAAALREAGLRVWRL